MENNDIYYKKYMKYKLKYLNLLNNYQSNDTSESLNADKILKYGGKAAAFSTFMKFGPKVLKAASAAGALSGTQSTGKSSTPIKKKESTTDMSQKIINLNAERLEKLLKKLIENDKIKEALKKILNKEEKIIICDIKKEKEEND